MYIPIISKEKWLTLTLKPFNIVTRSNYSQHNDDSKVDIDDLGAREERVVCLPPGAAVHRTVYSVVPLHCTVT